MTTSEYLPTWTCTTDIDRPARGVLEAVVGDYADDFDLGAAEEEYLAAIDAALPDGYTICRNGMIIGPANGERPDVEAIVGEINVIEILDRHDLVVHAHQISEALTAARAAQAAATVRAREFVVAMNKVWPETRLAVALGIDRMTVRKWLGKR